MLFSEDRCTRCALQRPLPALPALLLHSVVVLGSARITEGWSLELPTSSWNYRVFKKRTRSVHRSPEWLCLVIIRCLCKSSQGRKSQERVSFNSSLDLSPKCLLPAAFQRWCFSCHVFLFEVLEMEARALPTLSKCSVTEPHPQSQVLGFGHIV